LEIIIEFVTILDSFGFWGQITICSYEPGETRVATVTQDMESREAFQADVRYRLEQAQAS
jgi:hypothetical protein